MNKLLLEEQKITGSSGSSRKQPSSLPFRLFRLLIWGMIILSLATGIVLLISDAFPALLPHAPVSATPLLLIGASYLCFQMLSQPKPLDLFRALIVCLAFILWGIDQLLPSGWLTTTLGDIVITLYVLDLAWMMLDRLRQKGGYVFMGSKE